MNVSKTLRERFERDDVRHDLRFAVVEYLGDISANRPGIALPVRHFLERAIARQCVTGWEVIEAVDLVQWGEPVEDRAGRTWPQFDRGFAFFFGPDHAALRAFNETARPAYPVVVENPLSQGRMLQANSDPDADHAFAFATSITNVARNTGDGALPLYEGPLELGEEALGLPRPEKWYSFPKGHDGNVSWIFLSELRQLRAADPRVTILGVSVFSAAARTMELVEASSHTDHEKTTRSNGLSRNRTTAGPSRQNSVPKVLISSTASDLEAYRASARDAALAAGFYPEMMEYWPAADNPPLSQCLQRVDQADVVIAIVAHRFGWVPADQEGPPEKHKSITWLECERAVANGKHLLVFVVDENQPWDETKKEEYEVAKAAREGTFSQELATKVQWKITRLREFKQWLSDGRIRATFTTPDNLGRKVGEALRRRGSPMPETPPTSPLDPRTLPGLFPPPWASVWGEDDWGLFAELLLPDEVEMRLRWIPPGEFIMGSPENERGRFDDEGPQHSVTVTQGFWLSETPCTQAQYEAVTGQRPSHFDGERRPVENVGWHDAISFCEELNRALPDLGARLPTEAEWEHACRAETRTAFNDGSDCTEPHGTDPALDRLGWFEANSGGETHPVGEKQQNAWGLYDMHGNVLEWCADGVRPYSDERQTDPRGPDEEGAGRVVRGGGYGTPAGICRAASRNADEPGLRHRDLGFRLAAGPSGPSGARQQE